MRIYDGSPRQDFAEVLRSIGAYLDQRGMKDVLVMEAPDGYIVQGVTRVGATTSTWSESMGQIVKETMTFLDDDIGRFMDESIARRGTGPQEQLPPPGRYEHALRVIGHYIDEQKPRDIFFFEQDGAFVVRLHNGSQAGALHALVEFTREDVEALITRGPTFRLPPRPTGPDGAASS
ncbi:MAG: hypothetical protein HYX54_06165 [Chloroflexi bacterium]|nr:hypothetical protein [Chloroflexota bacterium]